MTDIRDIAYYAEIAAHRTWDAKAHQVMAQLAQSGRPFTADDFRKLMGATKPHHPNTVGAYFRNCRQNGLITPTGVYVESQTVSRRHAAIRQWIGTPAKTLPRAA